MKTNKIYLLLFLLMIGILGCEQNQVDEVISMPNASFYSESTSLTIDSDSVEYLLAVQLSETYTADKVVNVVATDASTAEGIDYSFTGSLVVKAGELTAQTPISFNFDVIPLNVPRTLVLNIEGTNEEITVTYTKVCLTNDVNLSLTFDNYPGETSWDIKDASGSVVESGSGGSAGQTVSLDFTLADGTYTFTIYDSFGDGICCTYGNGSYSLTKPACSVILANGGDFTSSESVTFSVP